MNQLKTFNPNNQAVAFATRKKHEPDKFNLILEKLSNIETRLTNVETRLSNVETNQTNDHKLLLKVIELNNLKTK